MNPKSASGLAGDTLLTHLNTTGDSRGSSGKYTDSTFIFGLSYQVSDLLIKVFQDYFQSNSLVKTLNTKLAKVNKEVSILDQFTPDTMRLPQIVVTSLPVDHIPLSFGNRIEQVTYDDHVYDVYGGQVNIGSTIEIYDSGKPNVHELADLVFLGLMQYVPMRMGTSQIIVDTAKVRFANATKTTSGLGGDVYRINLTVPLISEWRQYFEIETVDVETIRNTITCEETNLK
jgi:hypothetical protein